MQNSHPEVVAVTGASAGVGRAIVRQFARDGCRIGLLARNEQRLQSAQREIESLGGQALVLPTDVADAQQVEQAAERIEQTWGPIDIWINNAMTTVFSPFIKITAEEFKRATEVTYLGTVYGTMSALKRMRPRDHGTIVQVGSALSYRAIPLQSPYCGAKHAVRGFTDSIRCELLHEGSNVHITMVQLPAVNTPQFNWCKSRLPNHPQPVPPIFQPELAAEATVWAARHRRREVNLGHSTLKVIWGNKLFPALVDHYLARTGYDGQQTEEVIEEDRPFNLFETVPGHDDARGIFDDRAQASSWQWTMTKNRNWFLLGALAGLTITGMARRLA